MEEGEIDRVGGVRCTGYWCGMYWEAVQRY